MTTAQADRRLDFREEELDRWERLSRRLRVPFHHDGVISQFEGYEDAGRVRLGGLPGTLRRHRPAGSDSARRRRQPQQLPRRQAAGRLDAVLSALGRGPARDAAAAGLPARQGRRPQDRRLLPGANQPWINPESPVCSWLLARADRTRSWSLFNEALDSDLADIQRGTTREGVHLGAMAGTVDLILRCYTGLETRDDVLRLHPILPPELDRVQFQLNYRGHGISQNSRPPPWSFGCRPAPSHRSRFRSTTRR